MTKVWQVSPKFSDDIVEQLLYNRGLKSREEIDEFLNPNLDNFEKDFDIEEIEKAKKRILQAIEKKELIIVYGDYDVDGVCGAAVLYHGLISLGAKVLPYIPHREKEGYGLSKAGLQTAKEKGAKLIVTVDNGIVAIDEAEFAATLGLDLIITDHHVALEKKPQALAIVHSTKMCGAAVGWCLIRKLLKDEDALKLLDFVAAATICDLIPLLGVNRALVKTGLEKLNQTKRVGWLALFNETKLVKGEITAYHIGHILGPRINAIGRLEHAIDALRLLCTKDMEKAKSLAKLLCQTNDHKKRLTEDAILQAKEIVDKNLKNKKILVLYSEFWIPGILGLIAGRLADEYRLPTIAIASNGLQCKGSARSVAGLDIIETIRKHSDLLIDIGGHPQAAGFTIETSKIETFKTRLEQEVELINLDTEEKLQVEVEVDLKEASRELIEKINLFEPTGMGNPKPVLASFKVPATGLKAVGDGHHLKFKSGGVEAIAFSFGSLVSKIKEGQLLDVAYYLELNKFNGYENLQLKVLDIQLS